MKEIINYSVMLLIMAGIAIVAGWVAGFQTETKYRIPLNFKPFTCKPCMTFWLTMALCVPFGISASKILIESWEMDETGSVTLLFFSCASSFFIALLNFFYVKSKYNIRYD